MPEASEFDVVDNGSSILGALVEEFVGLIGTAEVTGALAEQGDTMNFLFRCHGNFEGTEELIALLEGCTKSRMKATIAFGTH